MITDALYKATVTASVTGVPGASARGEGVRRESLRRERTPQYRQPRRYNMEVVQQQRKGRAGVAARALAKHELFHTERPLLAVVRMAWSWICPLQGHC
jgi:hypothetical protein